MKRNMKFLLLLAIFTSSIMAAYFITGCGDDSTVIEFPPPVTNDTTVIIEETDQVIGNMTGTVRNGYDNGFLAGVTVIWTNGDSVYTTTTDANGYYTTPANLPSGDYEFTFNLTGYAVTSGFDDIPDLDELRSDNPNIPAGNIYYTEVLDAWLLPMTARITGKVYTALPAPGKDQNDPMTLDDPTLVSALQGVTIILEYGNGFDIHPDIYTATTLADGSYSFDNVPLVFSTGDAWWETASKDGPPDMALADPWEVDLEVQPFQPGPDTSYAGWTLTNISMVAPPGQAVMPTIFVAVAGSGDDADVTDNPVVLTYNFENPGFTVTDDLEFLFSKAMDPTTLNIDFKLNGTDVDFADSVSADGYWLYLNPALSLLPDEDYDIEISGKAIGGLDLWDSEDNNFTWDRELTTQDGMRFVSTNLDDYGDEDNPFVDFPLDGNITVTFDMDVVLPTPGDPLTGWVVLKDDSFGREVNAVVSASGATITINPDQNLKSFTDYELDFKVFSPLRGDFVTDYEVRDNDLIFTTVNTADIPPPPANFALDMGVWVADWNTTSINFQWDRSAGAEYYEIFAQDNKANTDFILVASMDDVDYNTWMEGTVDFTEQENLQFDLYDDDTLNTGADLQTPFSGGTEISFKIRAVNSAGASAFTALAAPVGDEKAPTYAVTQTGTADNTAGADEITFDIDIPQIEYLSAVAFAFVEGSAVMGGDPLYVLPDGEVAVEWDWTNDMRDGSGVVTVPIGACASADSMIVSITDNSGNVGRTAYDLRPYIVFTEPTAASTEFEAPTPAVEWTIHDVVVGPISSGTLDLYWSDNSGVDWLDSDLGWKAWNDSITTWTAFDTVYSTTFMLGLGDHDGGWIWKSDVFNYTGIDVTGPDSTWLDDGLFYDREGVDSTSVPLTWAYAGLDSVAIQYNVNGGAWETFEIVTVTGGTGTYDFYAPDTGADYVCNVRVADWDADSRPNDEIAWTFDVTNDWVNITAPIAGEMVAGGSLYDVTWDTVYVANSEIGLAYVIGIDTTWIVASTANDGLYTWATPANTFADNTARLLMYDRLSRQILDEVGTFSITGIVVDAPLADVEWLTGSSYNIAWTEYGPVGDIHIYWSRDGFVLDSSLVVAVAPANPHNWSVPANSACSTVTFRIFGKTATDTVYITSAEMTFSGVVVTSPVAGNLAQGAATSITWETIGTLVGPDVDIDYMYITTGPPIFTSNWIELSGVEANDGEWTWDPIPAPPAEVARVMISQAGTGLGSDQGADFSISGVVLIAPNGGEVWSVGSVNDIHWNEINSVDVGDVTIALYQDPGAVFQMNLQTGVSDTDWTWTIPTGFPASANYYIVITSENVPTITDASDAVFEVLSTMTVTAPNGGETWTLGTGQNITWTHTGLAVNIKLQYNLGGGWVDIVGATGIDPATLTFAWGLDPGVDVGLAASTTCRVRAVTEAGPLIWDDSDADFEIQPAIAITAPNGGEIWTLNTPVNITWSDIGVTNNVKLQYYTDGATWLDIAGAGAIAPGTNTFNWLLDVGIDAGLEASVTCQVRVVTTAGPLVSDASDADFEIRPSIEVTYPNGGEAFALGTPETLTWTDMGLLANVKIQYTLDYTAGPVVWFDIVNADAIVPGTNSFIWNLDVLVDTDLAGANSGLCRVRVTAVSGPAASDESDANFTIAPAP